MIDRYLLGGGDDAAAVLRRRARRLVRCSSRARAAPRVDRGRRRAARVYGAGLGRDDAEPVELRNTLAYHEDFHKGLAAALRDPGGRARTAPLPAARTLPNNKLIPDARWILDTVGQHDIVARSQARADVRQGLARAREPHPQRQRRRLPARQRVFYEAIVDVGDDPRDQVPQDGFKRIFTSRYYAVYGNC